MKKIKLFLADDHAILRDGLKSIIENNTDYEIVGESGNGREALNQIEKIKPDIAILDISMPGMTGIEITRQLKKYHPQIKIIILSRHDNFNYIKKLLDYGVNGYIVKEYASHDLLNAIDEILKGNIYLSPKITSILVSNFTSKTKSRQTKVFENQFDILSDREKEILKLIAEGNSSQEISNSLFISPETVKVHRTNIMKKLNIHKSTHLVTFAIKNGLVEI